MQAHAYVEAFTARGVLLWREGDALKYRAPLGVLTPPVIENLLRAKPKILPLLPSAGDLEHIGTGKPQLNHKPGGLPTHLLDQAQTLNTEHSTKLNTEKAQTVAPGRLPKSQTLDTEHFTKASPLLAWALSEARRGTLPELSEAMTLPSGQVCPADGVAAWLLAAETRASGLRSHSGSSPDCALALEVVLRDMRELALWAAHARAWLDAPRTHQGSACSWWHPSIHEGALCLLPAVEEELRQLAAEFEADLPEVEPT